MCCVHALRLSALGKCKCEWHHHHHANGWIQYFCCCCCLNDQSRIHSHRPHPVHSLVSDIMNTSTIVYTHIICFNTYRLMSCTHFWPSSQLPLLLFAFVSFHFIYLTCSHTQTHLFTDGKLVFSSVHTNVYSHFVDENRLGLTAWHCNIMACTCATLDV